MTQQARTSLKLWKLLYMFANPTFTKLWTCTDSYQLMIFHLSLGQPSTSSPKVFLKPHIMSPALISQLSTSIGRVKSFLSSESTRGTWLWISITMLHWRIPATETNIKLLGDIWARQHRGESMLRPNLMGAQVKMKSTVQPLSSISCGFGKLILVSW